MAYKQIKLADFSTTGSNHEDLVLAQARKTFYESELLRIQCAKTIQEAKDAGNPIQVQGNQND